MGHGSQRSADCAVGEDAVQRPKHPKDNTWQALHIICAEPGAMAANMCGRFATDSETGSGPDSDSAADGWPQGCCARRLKHSGGLAPHQRMISNAYTGESRL